MKFDKKVMESGIVAAFSLILALTSVCTRNVTTQTVSDSQEVEFTAEPTSEYEMKTEVATKEKKEGTVVAASMEMEAETEPDTESAQQKEVKKAAQQEEAKEQSETKKASGKEKKAAEKEEKVRDALVEQGSEEVSPWASRLMPKVEEYLNIRTEASDEAELAGKLYKGAAADILEKGDEWTKISSGSVEGYVKNEFCVTGLEAEALANELGTTYATAVTGGVRVRESASSAEDITILDVMEEGGKLKVDTEAEAADGWVAVKTNDQTGYVSAEYVTVELELGKAISIEEEQAAIAAAEAEKARQAAAQQAATGSSTTQKAAVSASYDDVTLLGALIQCEAGSEPYEGKVAVGAVVMNRLRAGYAGSISGVIYQSGQFSPASSGSLSGVLSSGVSGSCLQAAQEAINGTDNVGGAKNFKRASSGAAGIVIGNHVFF